MDFVRGLRHSYPTDPEIVVGPQHPVEVLWPDGPGLLEALTRSLTGPSYQAWADWLYNMHEGCAK